MNNPKIINRGLLTLEKVPEAISDVLQKLEEIEKLLLLKENAEEFKKPVSTAELCKFLNVSEPTVARYRKKGIIPFMTIGSSIRYDIKKVVEALENINKKKNN